MASNKTTNNTEEVKVLFKDKHNSVVNAIRKTILDDVPTFAIEDVEIIKNESPLYDDMMAHRLGLIPLSTDLESYNFKSDCSCGGVGCALCEVKLTLVQEEEGYVLSSSIASDDPEISPVYKEIPVTKLKEGNSVEVSCKAILGTGREHAKWSPAHAYLREVEEGIELLIEPFGQLSSDKIYQKSIDILMQKIDELEANI